MPPLRPWIGMDQVDPAQRVLRQPRQQFCGVAGEQTNVPDIMGFDLRHDLRHAVDVGLATDEAALRKRARFCDQVLAAAEPDFKTDLPRRRIKELHGVGRWRAAEFEREPRQQMLDEIAVMRTELVSLAAAKERTRRAGDTAIVRRCLAIAGFAAAGAHRGVW